MKRMNTLVSVLVVGVLASPFAMAQTGSQGSAGSGAGSEYPSQYQQEGTTQTQESDSRLQQAQGNSDMNSQDSKKVGRERARKLQQQQKPPTN